MHCVAPDYIPPPFIGGDVKHLTWLGPIGGQNEMHQFQLIPITSINYRAANGN